MRTEDRNVTRKGFLGMAAALGALGATGVAGGALGAEASKSADGETGAAAAPASGDSPEHVPGEPDMTLDQLNAARQAHIDAAKEYVCADGTVIPEEYVKLRACVEGYGLGVGSENNDRCFDFFMKYFTPEDAKAYVQMPMGIYFKAADFAQRSGRPEDECEQICYDLSTRGLLMRTTRAGVHYYHQLAYAHGLWEYGLLAEARQDENYADFQKLETITEWADLHKTEDLPLATERASVHQSVFAADQALYTSETPFYYPVPVGADVLADGEQVLPLDDWRGIIARNQVICVSPCQCRLRRVLQDDVNEGCDHPMETCLTFGEEAQYYIDNGLGRQIDQDEATAVLERSVDLGMVVQCAYTMGSEVICSCHGDCCDILSSYVALGAEGCSQINSMPNLSHYNLVVDTDKCVKCGACAERCPLFAITMTDDGPQVDAKCVRCGQCATVCPVDARKLSLRDDLPSMPADMLEDYNLKASYRFAHGIVHE